MTRVLRLGLAYWPALLLAVVFMAFVGLCQSGTAALLKPLIDEVLTPTPPAGRVLIGTIPIRDIPVYLDQVVPFSLSSVWNTIGAAILIIFFVKGVSDYIGNFLVNYVGLHAITNLRQRIFDHILRQDSSFFETNSTGRLMSSIMNDVEKIQTAISHLLADLLRQTFTAVALLTLIIGQDWRMAAFALTVLPVVLVPTARFGRKIRRSTRTAQDDQAQLNHVLQEAIAGQQVVRGFGAEAAEGRRFFLAAESLRRSSLRYVALQALPSPLIEFLGAVSIVALLGFARVRVEAGGLTAGAFTSFVAALLLLYEPIKRLTGIYAIFQQAAGAAQRVFEYLDQAPRITDAPDARPLAPFSHSIEFDRVEFRYPTSPAGQPPVLNGIQLTVARGEIVALAGPSGAGKTTLAGLVPRFHDPQAGAIRIDGQDLRHVTLQSLRSQLAIVSQETFLFDDTVANNIRYGRPGATLEQVQQAAIAALAHDFILRLPEGYDTRIGERGAKLSGGQKQRLAIARAVLRDAPILILDEATSHLDAESETLVQRALADLMAHRTTIVIAHRLSTIRRASRILVLDRGQIVQSGTHDQLLEQGGLYARLYELQFSQSAPDA